MFNHFYTKPPEGVTLEVDTAVMNSALAALPHMPEDPDLADRWIHWLQFYAKARRELAALHANPDTTDATDNIVPIRSA